MVTTPRRTRAVPRSLPDCGSRDLSRKGTRRKKFETVQLWRCRACARIHAGACGASQQDLSPSCDPRPSRGTTSATHSKIRVEAQRPVRIVGRVLIRHAMVSRAQRTHSTALRLRHVALPPPQTVRAIKLYHRQVYHFAYQRRSSRFCGTPRASPLRETASFWRTFNDC